MGRNRRFLSLSLGSLAVLRACQWYGGGTKKLPRGTSANTNQIHCHEKSIIYQKINKSTLGVNSPMLPYQSWKGYPVFLRHDLNGFLHCFWHETLCRFHKITNILNRKPKWSVLTLKICFIELPLQVWYTYEMFLKPVMRPQRVKLTRLYKCELNIWSGPPRVLKSKCLLKQVKSSFLRVCCQHEKSLPIDQSERRGTSTIISPLWFHTMEWEENECLSRDKKVNKWKIHLGNWCEECRGREIFNGWTCNRKERNSKMKSLKWLQKFCFWRKLFWITPHHSASDLMRWMCQNNILKWKVLFKVLPSCWIVSFRTDQASQWFSCYLKGDKNRCLNCDIRVILE